MRILLGNQHEGAGDTFLANVAEGVSISTSLIQRSILLPLKSVTLMSGEIMVCPNNGASRTLVTYMFHLGSD